MAREKIDLMYLFVAVEAKIMKVSSGGSRGKAVRVEIVRFLCEGEVSIERREINQGICLSELVTKGII